ncbi:hypothetical protein [Burkholderia cepacia]|uniref:hypothetical protein n=1 Tax=Burkholderia cepacia TaxID=292 RepID=UPI001CF1E775|nr:hypothetical protein [Burkholderia cepacia]MCA8354202.1 hypothetical protein [Burkholderia cepacia]
MNQNQSNTNEKISLQQLKHTFAEIFMEHGNEHDVLNVLVQSVLQDLKDEELHVRNPLELVHSDEGQAFITGWVEAVGGERLSQVFAILMGAGERLPEGNRLTDFTSIELVSWAQTSQGVKFQIEVKGNFLG